MAIPQISVIIPAYNAAATIGACVDAVISQEGVELEVILVDDGSTDATPEICDRLAASDSRIKVIHQTNQGVSAARNAGLSTSQGRYIYFADADDRVLPGGLAAMLSAIERTGVDLVIANYEEHILATDRHNPVNLDLPTDRPLGRDFILDEIFHRLYIERTVGLSNLWNKLFTRHIITEHNLKFDPLRTHGEDWAFIIDYLMGITTISVIPESVYSYKLNGTQIFSKYSKGLITSILEHHRIIEQLRRIGTFPRNINEDAIFIIRSLRSIFDFIISSPNQNDIKVLKRDKTLKIIAKNIITFNKSQLKAAQTTRQVYLIAVLILIGCWSAAIHQYQKGI